MPGFVERLPNLAEERHEGLAELEGQVSDPGRDSRGSVTNLLALECRFRGAAAYLLSGDVAGFRRLLSKSAALQLSLLERFDAGADVDPSYASMLAYTGLLDALAAGDRSLARAYAEKLGGRETVEAHYDNPFNRAFGRALKSAVLDDAATPDQLTALENACAPKATQKFAEYAKVLRAIADRDEAKAKAAFLSLLATHRRLSRRGGLFGDMEDEALAIWPLAVANLAAWRGLQIIPDDELVPAALVG